MAGTARRDRRGRRAWSRLSCGLRRFSFPASSGVDRPDPVGRRSVPGWGERGWRRQRTSARPSRSADQPNTIVTVEAGRRTRPARLRLAGAEPTGWFVEARRNSTRRTQTVIVYVLCAFEAPAPLGRPRSLRPVPEEESDARPPQDRDRRRTGRHRPVQPGDPDRRPPVLLGPAPARPVERRARQGGRARPGAALPREPRPPSARRPAAASRTRCA